MAPALGGAGAALPDGGHWRGPAGLLWPHHGSPKALPEPQLLANPRLQQAQAACGARAEAELDRRPPGALVSLSNHPFSAHLMANGIALHGVLSPTRSPVAKTYQRFESPMTWLPDGHHVLFKLLRGSMQDIWDATKGDILLSRSGP